MGKLVFPMGFMRNSGISSIESESWEMEEEWKDGLRIFFAYFWTFLPSQRGTPIGTGKGGGQRTKGIVNSSSEIRDVSWFKIVGEVEKSWGSSSPCKQIRTKPSNSYFNKSLFMSFLEISQQRWRNRLEKSSTNSFSFILKRLTLLQTLGNYTCQSLDGAPWENDEWNGWK